jgi:hypothetical protein
VRVIEPNNNSETSSQEPKKKRSRKPVKEQISEVKALEMFEEYWLQGINGGPRNYREIGRKFGFSYQQVMSLARTYGWEERIAVRAQGIAKRLDENAIEKVAEIKKEFHNLIRGLIKDWFAQRLGGDEEKAMTLSQMEATDIVRLVKLDLTLLGQPDTIKAVEGTVQVKDNISGLSTEDLRAIIEERRKRLPAATVEATPVTPPAKDDNSAQ